jgi:RNA-directed DNA polymerase
MNGHGKSDSPVVPAMPPNKAAGAVAEAAEGRGLAEGNADGPTRPGHRAGPGVPSGLDRVREVARRDKDARFTALLHHVSLERLVMAYWDLSPKAAPGVDGVTWEDYGQDLAGNLRDLHDRVHSGRYQARPSRRAYIPKADGRLRPLGIAALEDKIVQRAVTGVLNAIYETDFLGFSYGFRPGRSPHDALDALAAGIYKKKVNWVLDADIRDFFTSLDQGWLERFLGHRVADKRILRLVGKWLGAGVIENGTWSKTPEGSPQGASVSPLLANVYLHYVLDLWAEWWRRRHARGDMIIVRFADDFIAGFEHLGDARQFLRDLRERFARFCLELHPGKTRLIEFGRFAAVRRAARGAGKPETFDFLGFTHICGKTRAGRFQVRRITISKRMRAKLKEVKDQLKQRRHEPVPEQGRWLGSVVRGHMAYYAVPGNIRAVRAFRTQVTRHWRAALQSRSQRGYLNWHRMNRLATRWLPPPRILHPYPDERFHVRTRGRSPVR